MRRGKGEQGGGREFQSLEVSRMLANVRLLNMRAERYEQVLDGRDGWISVLLQVGQGVNEF